MERQGSFLNKGNFWQVIFVLKVIFSIFLITIIKREESRKFKVKKEKNLFPLINS